MNDHTRNFHISITPFLWVALLLLACPSILFLIGWYHPVVASSASALILGSIYFLMRKLRPSLLEYKLSLTRFDLVKLAISTLVLLVYLVGVGFMGYYPTNWDTAIARQAFFMNLTDAPWPVVLPNGKEFTYFIAGIMPPALVARLVDESLRQAVLLAYVFILSSFIYILACFYLKKISFILLILLLFLHDPTASFVIKAFGYIFVTSGLTTENVMLFTYQFSPLDLSPIGASMGAYNSGLFSLLVTLLVLIVNKQRHVAIPLLIVLLVPCSPLGALALMPIALYYYLPLLKEKAQWISCGLALLIPVALTLIYAVYFLRATETVTVTSLSWFIYGEYRASMHLFIQIYSCLFLVLPLILTKQGGRLKYFLFVPIILSVIYFGVSPEADAKSLINELFLKGGVIYSLLACILWLQAWDKLKYFLLIILLPAFYGFFLNVITHVPTFDPERKVFDSWNGHFNHDHPFLDRGFPATKDGFLSEIILDESGESEKSFPGILLPKAPGCDYSRPINESKLTER